MQSWAKVFSLNNEFSLDRQINYWMIFSISSNVFLFFVTEDLLYLQTYDVALHSWYGPYLQNMTFLEFQLVEVFISVILLSGQSDYYLL